MATPFTSDEINQHQYDLLWNVMGSNPLLPYSAIASLNMQLNTNSKSVIKALNELLILLNTNNTTVTNFNTSFNTYVGNPQLNPTDWSTLQTIDTNIIRAVNKIYSMVSSGTGGGTPSVIDGGTF